MPCDTGVVRARGSTYFLKNSDRHPNEEQLVESHGPRPGTANQGPQRIRATFIEIENTREDSCAVILSRPHHMWGAEMGTNNFGVAVGNEAIFSTVAAVPHEPKYLTGMDLVRLAVERGRTAGEAVDVITSLLERFAQGGNCGYQDLAMYYHNGFVVCDATTCFVVIAIGREWGVLDRSEGATHSVVTLSNTIPREVSFADFARTSPRLREMCGEVNCCLHKALVQRRVGYPMLQDYFANGASRQSALHHELTRVTGDPACLQSEAAFMQSLFGCLRLHGAGPEPIGNEFVSAARALSDPHPSQVSVCMHAAWGPIRVCHTTGSMVARIGPLLNAPSTFAGDALAVDVWATMTSTPCMSSFKPVRFAPEEEAADRGPADTRIWWRHERLMRLFAVLPSSLAVRHCRMERELEAAVLQEFYERQQPALARRKATMDTVAMHCEQWSGKLLDAAFNEMKEAASKPWNLVILISKTLLNPLHCLQLHRLSQLNCTDGASRSSRELTAALFLPSAALTICSAILARRMKLILV